MRDRSAGFTLLELLLVLTIIALTVGLIAPSSSRWIDSVRERGWSDDARNTLSGLPLKAFADGRPLTVDAQALRLMLSELPGDAELELDRPLRYSATGLADGGRLVIRLASGRKLEWSIEAVTGRVIP